MYQYTCQLKEGCKCISNINLFNCLIHLYSICYHVWLLKRVFIYPKESPPYKVTSLLVLIRLIREIIEYSWFVALSSSTHYCTLYRPHLLLPYFYYALRWAMVTVHCAVCIVHCTLYNVYIFREKAYSVYENPTKSVNESLINFL